MKLCFLDNCTQEHILRCPILTKEVDVQTVQPEMIFGSITDQILVVKMYQKLLKIRTTLLNEG